MRVWNRLFSSVTPMQQDTEKKSLMSRPGNARTYSLAAERMRLHRNRRRQGLRCITVELRETEIDALVRRGLLKAETRNDMYAVRRALYQYLDQTLGATW